MSKPTLVILAAGIGSRYGGLKQLDSFSEQKDTILDFSLYDAIRAGFGKVIFIIRKEIEQDFTSFFNPKLEGKIEVEYAFQEVDKVPDKFKKDLQRTKPWGTAHALLMVKSLVKENFVVINADDFYGKEAFEVMAKEISKIPSDAPQFLMMGYKLKNTISKFGSVSRGECMINQSNLLTGMIERTHIEFINDELQYKTEEEDFKPIALDTTVSMNFFGFTPAYFNLSDSMFHQFMEENYNSPKAEFLIPSVVNHLIKNELATMEVLTSNAKWFGVTYKEDKEFVTSEISKLKSANIYPKQMW